MGARNATGVPAITLGFYQGELLAWRESTLEEMRQSMRMGHME